MLCVMSHFYILVCSCFCLDRKNFAKMSVSVKDLEPAFQGTGQKPYPLVPSNLISLIFHHFILLNG